MSEFDTITTTCGTHGVPSTLPSKLKELDDTEFEEQDGAQYQDVQNDIGLPKSMYKRLQDGDLNKFDLTSLFNEMFHAYFDQAIEEQGECSWVLQLMRTEATSHYGGDLDMVEEAMSETIDVVVGSLVLGSALGQAPNLSYDSNAQAPEHRSKGEKWHGKAAAKRKISESIYLLTVYILYFDCENPHGHDAAQQQANMTAALAEEGVSLTRPESENDDSEEDPGEGGQ